MSALPRLLWVIAQSSGTRSRVRSCRASRQAVTASSSRAVPLSRSPAAHNAPHKLFWVMAQSSGTSSRVFSFSASRKALIASSSRAVPLSLSPSRMSALPRLFSVAAQSSGTRSRDHSFKTSRNAITASSSCTVPLSRSPAAQAHCDRRRSPLATAPSHFPAPRAPRVRCPRRPVERSFRKRCEVEASAIDIDRLDKCGIVSKFLSLRVKLTCLAAQEAPLLKFVEGGHETSRFRIFCCRRPVGKL
jgi:hypothetical protein